MKLYFRRNIFILFLILSVKITFSQIPVGTWRTHYSYNNVISVCDADDKIFAANEIDIFSYTKNDETIEKLNKVNGLSDAGISKINYNKSTKTLLIAYSNSNIDILRNDTIFNFSEIKRKQISGSKAINSIKFVGDSVYLSCDFGIVIFDTRKLEFADTYIIGENSEMIGINGVSFNNSFIFAATNEGLYKADKYSINLSDYRNWTKITDIPNPDYKINQTENIGDIVYASQKQSNTETTIVYKLKNDIWTSFDNELNYVKSISANPDFITFANDGKIKVYDKFENSSKALTWYNFEDSSTYIKANFAITDNKNDIWIADKRFGLVSKLSGKSPEKIMPDGPEKNLCSRLKFADLKIIATHGSSSGVSWNEGAYSILKEENWKTHYLRNSDAFEFNSIAVNPSNSEDIYIGSRIGGIYQFKNDIFFKNYDETNSTLQTVLGYVSISDMLFDINKNFWVSNWYVPKPVSVLTASGNWYSYNFGGLLNNKYAGEMILTKDNFKWLILSQSGIFAFDDVNTPETESDDRYKYFYPITNEGETVSQNVSALAEDKDGNIWVGTDNGVVVYYSPSDIFENNNFRADRIQLTTYGNDTTEQYLLSTDVVTKICIDGANRKWIGTQNSGLFLVSDNGKNEIHNFNTTNSPLISNTILDLAINEKTGEVFIANEGGILSFRSDATKGGEDFENVYVFPNPVRPDYNGIITVTGLAENVNVKITDISGNLVYETEALGGQASWNGKTFSGRKVNTGVYLIFCTNSDGSKTFVTKLLLIN
jgi:hypothetical protein